MVCPALEVVEGRREAHSQLESCLQLPGHHSPATPAGHPAPPPQAGQDMHQQPTGGLTTAGKADAEEVLRKLGEVWKSLVSRHGLSRGPPPGRELTACQE